MHNEFDPETWEEKVNMPSSQMTDYELVVDREKLSEMIYIITPTIYGLVDNMHSTTPDQSLKIGIRVEAAILRAIEILAEEIRAEEDQ